MNQDMVLALALPITLFCIMFAMGCSLQAKNFKQLMQQPASLLTGIIAQMLLLPLLAFTLLSPLNLPTEIFIGFMILALSPGGTTSNMLSYMINGNLALSVSLTAVVSLVTPFSIPLLAGWILADQLGSLSSIHLPFIETVLKLIAVTLIPVSLGMLLRYYRAAFCLRYQQWITRIPFIMLLLVIAGIILQNLPKMPYFIEQTALPALLLATLAIVAGYSFARLMQQGTTNARTIAIETSIQNGGTAILVTGTILNNPTMTIAPVMYGILMLIPAFLYIFSFKFRYRLAAV